MTTQPPSLSAQAVLTAVTQQEYGMDPGDIPNEAGRIKCLVAAALHAVAHWVDWESGDPKFLVLAIAAELSPTKTSND